MAASPQASSLRGAGDVRGEGHVRGNDVVGLAPFATTPPTGAPSESSAKWFEDKLAAERASLAHYLEQRHSALMVEFRALAREPKELQERAAELVAEDVTSEDDLTTAPQEEKLPGFELPGQMDSPFRSEKSANAHFSVLGKSTDPPSFPLHLENISTGERNSERSLTAASHNVKLSEVKRSIGVGKDFDEFASKPWTYQLVSKPAFEGGVACIIMINVLVMAAQIQYKGFDIGYQLGYRWYEHTPRETWVHADTVFDTFDYVFGTIYILEMILKILAFRRAWVFDVWNWFDALIVAFWLLEKPFKDVLTLPADATILRTARLFKLLRLVKVIKTLNGFDSLYLLITTLKGSVSILAWSCVLLLVVQILIAFTVFMILTEAYFYDDFYPVGERQKVFSYFGSFSRAMLTMFEMTLANWPPVCRLLVENVSEWFMLFFVAHKLTIGFAVIGVINGVFMQETFKVASSDDSIMMRSKEREVKTYTEKMQRLFLAADESGDGNVDIDEFRALVSDREILTWLASMELPVRDPASLFELLDTEGAGTITAETMCKGALKLRGPAKSVDVLAVQKQLESIQRSLSSQVADRKLSGRTSGSIH